METTKMDLNTALYIWRRNYSSSRGADKVFFNTVEKCILDCIRKEEQSKNNGNISLEKERRVNKMTSYEFEKAAKNAVIKVLNENISISELDLVWFAHELGYKKCTIWGVPMGDKYAEVTYNRDSDEMYVDIYQKICNMMIPREEFDMEAR